MGLTTGNGKIQPIYTHLYEKGLVEKEEFTLCLGKNGGKFIIGGLDETLKVHPDLPVQWVRIIIISYYDILMTYFHDNFFIRIMDHEVYYYTENIILLNILKNKFIKELKQVFLDIHRLRNEK